METCEASILLIDDNDDNLELLDEYLREGGYRRIRAVRSAEEAFGRLRTEVYDLIILDIMMPKIDGIEACRRIKDDPCHAETPVIMATARTDDATLVKSFEAGASDYIKKPMVNGAELLVRVRNAIALKRKIDQNRRLNALLKEKIGKIEEFSRLMEAMLDLNQESIAIIEHREKVKLANRSFREFFGEGHVLQTLLKKIDFEKEGMQHIEQAAEGIYRNFETIVKPYHEDFHIVSLFDTTRYEKFYKDALTGIFTRQFLDEWLRKKDASKICLIFFDIDDFKRINDTYGHLIGDAVLKKVAETALGNLRREDILMRWGGEEFLVIVSDVEDRGIWTNVAEKLREKIARIRVEKIKRPITCSFGVCCGSVSSRETFEELLKRADAALYRAKDKGKDCIETC